MGKALQDKLLSPVKLVAAVRGEEGGGELRRPRRGGDVALERRGIKGR